MEEWSTICGRRFEYLKMIFLFWKHAITLFHSVMFFMSRVCYESHHYDLQVWTFLMGYHEYGSTYAEREYLMSIRKSEYETIKRQWQVSY